MAFPPPVPPSTRTNATPMADNHPNDHNQISAALTEIINHLVTVGDPIGTVQMWTGTTAPIKYLLCRGQTELRATYPALFAVCGTRFGAGDGTTTFNVPDLRARGPVGYNDGTDIVAGDPVYGMWMGGVGQEFGQPVPTLINHMHEIHMFTGEAGGAEGGGSYYVKRGDAVVGMANGSAHNYVSTTGIHQHDLHGDSAYKGSGDQLAGNYQPGLSLNFIIRALA